MKKGIHPPYRPVLFRCSGSGKQFVVGSTKINGPAHDHEGKDFPSILVEVTAYCHPFYTGKQQFIDTQGRVEKFNNRFKRTTAKKD